MKSPLLSRFMTLIAAVLLTASAFAAGASHKGTLEVADPVMVNGKQLAPGIYTVVWDSDGPQTSLHIMKGSKELAVAPCTVVTLDQKASQDATEVKNGSEGRELSAVRFSGQKTQLDIAGETGTAMKSGNAVK